MYNTTGFKGGLLQYGHCPKIHETISNGSSRTDFWTSVDELSVLILLIEKKNDDMIEGNIKQLIVSEFILRNRQVPQQNWTNQTSDML